MKHKKNALDFHLTLLSLLFVLVNINCTKKNIDYAPESLSGYELEGEFTSARGSFSGAKGQKFRTTFSDATHFYTQGPSGTILNTGNYEYSKLAAKKSQMFLIATSGDKNTSELKLILNFSSTDKGRFEGHMTQGPPGTQAGLFEIKKLEE